MSNPWIRGQCVSSIARVQSTVRSPETSQLFSPPLGYPRCRLHRHMHISASLLQHLTLGRPFGTSARLQWRAGRSPWTLLQRRALECVACEALPLLARRSISTSSSACKRFHDIEERTLPLEGHDQSNAVRLGSPSGMWAV